MQDIYFIEFIGIIAAILTTSAFLPQAIKAIKTKNTKDLSLSMYTMMVIGVFLWLVYGIMIQSFPIIMANFVTLILAVIILYMKVRFK